MIFPECDGASISLPTSVSSNPWAAWYRLPGRSPSGWEISLSLLHFIGKPVSSLPSISEDQRGNERLTGLTEPLEMKSLFFAMLTLGSCKKLQLLSSLCLVQFGIEPRTSHTLGHCHPHHGCHHHRCHLFSFQDSSQSCSAWP